MKLNNMAEKVTGLIGDPPPSPAVKGVTDNAWIRGLRTNWNSPPLHYFPRFRDGSMILDALIQYPIPIPAYDQLLDHHELYHRQAPTMEHIIADLIQAKDKDLNIVDQAIGHGTQSHKEQVLVSMWNAAYASSKNSDVKLFTIPDIPFHPEGSRKCGIGLVKGFLELTVADTDNSNGS